ncbi:MAG: glycosyltransferase family 2 protein [Polyangiales bacterium]
MSSSATPDPVGISVVVVNWNSRVDLAACLDALGAQSDRDFETIVVDNGSTDGSVEMVRARFSAVRIVETGANLGFAEGCNRGIEVARQPWVATLNNDADAAPGWIAALRAAAALGDARLGMLQSRIVFKQDDTRTNSTGLLLYANGCAEDRHYDQPVRPDESPEEIFCASAGAALYRRAMLDELRLDSGVFDRDYFMYAEDVDLGWRARLAGWSSIYVPTAVVRHSFQGSSRRHGPNFVELQCKKNRLRTLVKNASLPFLLRTIPRTLGDLAEATLKGGPAMIPAFARAAASAVRQRARVGRLVRVSRRAIERRWVTRTP